MMPDGVIAQLFAIAFLHVFPQCSVGIQVGRDTLWTGNGHEVSAEILYRSIGDGVQPRQAGWNDADMMIERDEALERRIISFHSRRYPQTTIFYAQCLKGHR